MERRGFLRTLGLGGVALLVPGALAIDVGSAYEIDAASTPILPSQGIAGALKELYAGGIARSITTETPVAELFTVDEGGEAVEIETDGGALVAWEV